MIIHRNALLAVWLLTLAAAGAGPRHVYLTWQDDPATSITVNYQTIHEPAGDESAGDAPSAPAQVRYDTIPHAGDASAYRWRASGTQRQFAESPGRGMHTVSLDDLQPGQAYWFVAGDSVTGFSRERAFRTVPDGEEDIRFVVGGDMGIGEKACLLQVAAARHDPLFAVVGGDLAYGDGDWAAAGIWDAWLDNWDRLMVTPDGFSVPIVAVVGNHEVVGGYRGSVDDAPLYMGFLPQGTQRTYYSRRIGSRIVLLVLDSGHAAPHGGRQAEWLAAELAAHSDVPVRLAAYHVPLFPVFRLPSSKWSAAGREHWQPLFDRYRLTTAFEHHDHAFKRTHPIRGKKIDQDGTLYLGDGSWGRGPRMLRGPKRTHLARRWYLDRLESKGHVWRVDVRMDSVVYSAVDASGEVFDRVARPVE